MKGLTIESLKKVPSLIPLFAIVGCAVGGSLLYLGRLAVKSPDVTFRKAANPTPWNDYANKQYKLYDANPSGNLQSPAPEY